MRVFKYHGTGNDFVLVENLSLSIEEESKPELARRLCNRRLGVGADGMLLVEPSERADIKFRYFNSDGSEAGMCGNGMRCFAKHVYDFSIVGSRCMRVETPAGEVEVCVVRSRGARADVRVNMGVPRFEPSEVPVEAEHRVLGMKLETAAGEVEVSAVNTGVPHAVVFVEDVEAVDVETLGRAVRWHPVFPEGANVNFVQVVDGMLKVRTYERGVEAETPACGTGITACCAVALELGVISGEEVKVLARGGELLVSTEEGEEGRSFCLTGPAVRVFRAEVDAEH
ncbi:MAG: diaminopimelate epimerase [Euryarchaeota archaeon]|nr:diaminopimelate epimerase [Euryarchaeota archaeon]